MNNSTRSKRATLRDVARHAEVSVATVSRVLNGSKLVTNDTKTRVDAAIDALGFVPSAAARSLNSGRSKTIGALVPTLDHSIFARYLDALEGQLSHSGYALVVAVTGGVPEIEERKAAGLLDMGVDGLVVSGRAHTPSFDALVDRYDVPTLITSFYDPSARYPTIGYDNASIAIAAVKFLNNLGHRSMAVVHGPEDVNDRIATRMDAIRSTPDLGEVGFFRVSMDVAGGADAVRQILASSLRPSAILCLSDVQALGALFELQRQNLNVPGDLSLMGFDNLEWSAISRPTITSIQLPAAAMGVAAGDALVAWIQTGRKAHSISIPAEIIVRDSTLSV